jgi:hypothetical protein
MRRAPSIRLQLSDGEARALHSALLEALAAELVPVARVAAARAVLDRLGSRVPGWLERSPVRGEAGYTIAANAVLRTLLEAEERGRSALTDTELAHGLGDAKPVGVSIDGVLARMRRERLIRIVGKPDGRTSVLAATPAGRRQWHAIDGRPPRPSGASTTPRPFWS